MRNLRCESKPSLFVASARLTSMRSGVLSHVCRQPISHLAHEGINRLQFNALRRVGGALHVHDADLGAVGKRLTEELA